MFHRVKSEVQGAEQNTVQEESKKGYQEEVRNIPSAGERIAPDSRDEIQERSYGRSQLKTQEEASKMKSREETVPSGKYSRETEARASEPSKASGYQPSVSRSSAYSSSYSGSSSYAAPSPSSEPYSGADRVLTIGRGINMSGEIEACDHLLVEGTVEAALKGAKVLDIADSGVFYGTVEIEEATIAGRFEGDITVNGRLTIKSSGVITGSIAYRELEVEAGAMLDGRMTPLKGNVDPKSVDRYRAGSDASAMAKAKVSPAKKDNREPANTERALFSKAHASY